MTPEQETALARSRYVAILSLQAAGVIVMLLGLWIWLGDILRAGGWPALGLPLFVLGAFESLLLPRVLAARWRTPPAP